MIKKEITVDVFCQAILKNLDNLLDKMALEQASGTEMQAALTGGLVRIFGAEIHALVTNHRKVTSILVTQDKRIKMLEDQIQELTRKEGIIH